MARRGRRPLGEAIQELLSARTELSKKEEAMIANLNEFLRPMGYLAVPSETRAPTRRRRQQSTGRKPGRPAKRGPGRPAREARALQAKGTKGGAA